MVNVPTFHRARRHGVRGSAALVCLIAFAVAPARAEMRFKHHFIDRDLPGSSYGQTSLVDVDRDGDRDFVTGGQDARRHIFWFEHQAPDRWVRHVLGSDHPSDVGGTAFDVDGDGWADHVSGGVWYRNTGKPRAEPFERIVFDEALTAVHDLVLADVDGDGRTDVVSMSDKNNLRWYRIGQDPRRPWTRQDIGEGVHAGVAVGDIDGDGDNDIARSNLWFENADGKGTRWVRHDIPFGNPKPPFPLATRCIIVDIDRDGHKDLVMTENEIRAGKIAWLGNADGKGVRWEAQELPAGDNAARGAYHSLAVADFDNDGDADIFSVEMEHIAGARQPRWYVWENTDGKGRFVERVILDNGLGGHEAVAADVDGDGDIDIASKLWRPRRDNANGGRNHADFLENLSKARAEGAAAAGAEELTARPTADPLHRSRPSGQYRQAVFSVVSLTQSSGVDPSCWKSMMARSAPPSPLTESAAPSRARTTSRPDPPKSESAPQPPTSVSLPSRPWSASLPDPPSSESSPAPPARVSLPGPPRSVESPGLSRFTRSPPLPTSTRRGIASSK